MTSVWEVSVGRSTGIDAAAGGGIGAASGAVAGRSTEGLVAGAVVLGAAGAITERGAGRTAGYEYVVRTDTGVLLTLVQGPSALGSGARVIVLYGSPSRVIAAPADG